jgi:hypothetical protein
MHFCHFVKNILSSRLPSKNLGIKTYIKYNNIFLCVCGCETWSLTLREEHRSRVSENRVLRRIFGRKREEVAGG